MDVEIERAAEALDEGDRTGVRALSGEAEHASERIAGRGRANRETFLFDPQGKIAKHYPTVDPKAQHAQAVVKDLKEFATAKS